MAFDYMCVSEMFLMLWAGKSFMVKNKRNSDGLPERWAAEHPGSDDQSFHLGGFVISAEAKQHRLTAM